MGEPAEIADHWALCREACAAASAAYFAVVVSCAIAALIVSSEARADLASVSRYLGWNLALLNFMEPNLPGLFEASRFTEVNGALWTLKIEAMFYLAFPILA